MPPPPEPEFQEPSKQAPVDLGDVLRRFGVKTQPSIAEAISPMPAPTTHAPSVQSVPRSAATEHAPRQPTAAATTADDNEESIDEYMSRLMQRVRPSGSESERPAWTPQRSQLARGDRDASAAADAEPLPSDSPAVSPQETPQALPPRPRSVPMSHRSFRLAQLANLSARHAIQQHWRSTLLRTMHGKLTVMFGVPGGECGPVLYMEGVRGLQTDTLLLACGDHRGDLLGSGICAC